MSLSTSATLSGLYCWYIWMICSLMPWALPAAACAAAPPPAKGLLLPGKEFTLADGNAPGAGACPNGAVAPNGAPPAEDACPNELPNAVLAPAARPNAVGVAGVLAPNGEDPAAAPAVGPAPNGLPNGDAAVAGAAAPVAPALPKGVAEEGVLNGDGCVPALAGVANVGCAGTPNGDAWLGVPCVVGTAAAGFKPNGWGVREEAAALSEPRPNGEAVDAAPAVAPAAGGTAATALALLWGTAAAPYFCWIFWSNTCSLPLYFTMSLSTSATLVGLCCL